MEQANLVSIIVPVYGVEKYLPECLDSLLEQTYRELEIILVDDASEDGCPQICEQYAKKDARVKVIHKPNGGAASARNVGIDAATGAYICFVDADDVVEKEYVRHLLTNLLETDADIAVCDYYNLTKKGCVVVKTQQVGLYSQTEYLVRFTKDWSCALLWNKIYRRNAIGSLRMAEGHCIDDEFFTYQVVMNSSRVVITDVPLYYYRIRSSGVMQNVGQKKQRVMMDRLEYLTVRYHAIAEKMPEIEPVFFRDALDSMTRYWLHSKNMPRAQKEIRRWAKAHRSKLLSMKAPLRYKLSCWYRLFMKKPSVEGEPNFIEISQEEAYD